MLTPKTPADLGGWAACPGAQLLSAAALAEFRAGGAQGEGDPC